MATGIRNATRRFGLSIAAFSCLAGPAQQLMAQTQVNQTKAGGVMKSDSTAAKDAKLRLEMQRVFEQYPEKFSGEIKKGFSERQVVIGMDPYLAHLSAGAFTYKVEADPSKWPSHADPMQVMWTQARHPDNSKIWMTFENDTQYPGQGQARFSVYIEDGKVKEIRKI